MDLKNTFNFTGEDWQKKLEQDISKGGLKDLSNLIKVCPNGFRRFPFYYKYLNKFYDSSRLPWDGSGLRKPGENKFKIYSNINETSYQNDYFSQFISEGRIDTELSQFASSFDNSIIRGDFIHEAGGSEVDEISFCLAGLIEYLKLSREDKKTKHSISFSLSYSLNFFMNIAKTRALKLIVKKLEKLTSVQIEYKIIGIGSKRDEGFFDIENNIVRRTIKLMSALNAGIYGFINTELEFAESSKNRLTQNLYEVLDQESFLRGVIDPAGGSFCLENYTESIIENTWKELQRIEAKGGLFQQIIEDSYTSKFSVNREKMMNDLYCQRKFLIGLNTYPNEKDVQLRFEELKTDESTYLQKSLYKTNKLDSSSIAKEFSYWRLNGMKKLNHIAGYTFDTDYPMAFKNKIFNLMNLWGLKEVEKSNLLINKDDNGFSISSNQFIWDEVDLRDIYKVLEKL